MLQHRSLPAQRQAHACQEVWFCASIPFASTMRQPSGELRAIPARRSMRTYPDLGLRDYFQCHPSQTAASLCLRGVFRAPEHMLASAAGASRQATDGACDVRACSTCNSLRKTRPDPEWRIEYCLCALASTSIE
jgi:hypothetical protein